MDDKKIALLIDAAWKENVAIGHTIIEAGLPAIGFASQFAFFTCCLLVVLLSSLSNSWSVGHTEIRK